MALRRGSLLLELLAGFALAVVFLMVFATAMTTQSLELREANAELIARELLLSAQERLRAGTLSPPKVGGSTEVGKDRGVTVTLERLDPAKLDSRLKAGGKLTAVVLRARWTSGDDELERTLVTLVRGGGA